MVEWFKTADCKSVELFRRRFESFFLQKMLIKILLNTLNPKNKEICIMNKYIENSLIEVLHLDLSIYYIISVKFTWTNISFTLSNIKGKTFFFYSAGLVKLKGKMKTNRKKSFDLIFKKFILECPFLKNKPISLHLIDVGFQTNNIIKQISKHFFVLILRLMSLTPHNGCRLRRKNHKRRRTKRNRRFFSKKH